MNDPTDLFKSVMMQAGLTPPDTIEPGRIYRFPGADKGRGNTAGRCFMFPDMRGGWYEDYSNGGEQINWQATGSKPYTQAERMANTERSKAANDAYRDRCMTGLAVGRKQSVSGSEAGILNGNGGKPNGMHWATYIRLQARHDAQVNQSLAGMAAIRADYGATQRILAPIHIGRGRFTRETDLPIPERIFFSKKSQRCRFLI